MLASSSGVTLPLTSTLMWSGCILLVLISRIWTVSSIWVSSSPTPPFWAGVLADVVGLVSPLLP
nr:MAG TPA: hypothetical protein [Caudoviricetes sp.]